MRKKALLIALCLCMAVFPVGCGKDTDSENNKENVTGTITPTAAADSSADTGNEITGTVTPTVLEQKYKERDPNHKRKWIQEI